MRFINWNIDSLRAALQSDSHRAKQSRKVLHQIAQQKYDVVGLQEVKLPPTGLTSQQRQLLMDLFPGYQLTIRTAQPPARKSYGGMLFMWRQGDPKIVEPKLRVPSPLNDQGRLLTLDFPDYFLLQVYSPNAGQHLEKADLHHQWNVQLIKYIAQMRHKKPVIVVGDFSMVYSKKDVAEVTGSKGRAGFTDADIADFHQLLQVGLVDAFRVCHPQTTDQYTWWPQIIRTSKQNNLGWRADFWLVDSRLQDQIKDSKIMDTGPRKDHAPIILEMK